MAIQITAYCTGVSPTGDGQLNVDMMLSRLDDVSSQRPSSTIFSAASIPSQAAANTAIKTRVAAKALELYGLTVPTTDILLVGFSVA